MFGILRGEGVRRGERAATGECVVQRALARVGETDQAEAFHSEELRLPGTISARPSPAVDLCDREENSRPRVRGHRRGCRPVSAGADQLGAQIPANCVAHTSFDGGADLLDDYRCAGIAIEFHTAGVAFSPVPIWAGQWLFVDEIGQFRVGSCTFNRGIHPTIDAPSSLVAQSVPNDPTGAKGAYLTWRYGDTTDRSHGSSDVGGVPLLRRKTAPARGGRRMARCRSCHRSAWSLKPAVRDDIQALAVQLDAEADRLAGPWAISVALGTDGGIDVSAHGRRRAVAGATVTLLDERAGPGSHDPHRCSRAGALDDAGGAREP